MKIFMNVKTSAIDNKLEKINELNYTAYVKERPVENRANNALLRLIAKKFDVSSRDVLIKNPTSKKRL